MRKNLLFQFILLSIVALAWMSSSGGRGTSANSGNTGAPGDEVPTCVTCHSTNAGVSVSMDISAADASGIVSQYVPGNSYTLTVTIAATSGSPAAYGFQMVALRDADNMSTNTFSSPSSNAQLATITNGRQYVEHDGPSSSGTFLVEWTAPAAGSGSVTFYAGGNGVNVNGATSGDAATTTSFTLTEDTGAANGNLTAAAWELSIFPNPVQNQINLSANKEFDGNYETSIIDMAGKLVGSRNISIVGGQASMDVANLSPGYYSFLIQNGDEPAVLKFSKL